ITVSQAVNQLIQTDEIALEALRAGLLNLSAFADKIHKEVERATFKTVKRGTIVVALSRAAKTVSKTALLTSSFSLSNIAVKSSLSVYTYEKTADIQRKMAILHPFLLPMNDLFSITEGPSEITIVFADKSEPIIGKHFGSKPKTAYKDLVAITTQFIREPDSLTRAYFAILSKLAV